MDLNYVVCFVLHRRDAVVVRMKDVLLSRRSGVASDRLGLNGRSREITGCTRLRPPNCSV